MYKNYNMTQLTLPIETSVRIPQNDISRYVNEIVERYLIANSMNSDIIVAQHPIIQKRC
ncbi:transposase [Staphylococcus aureus subsp. aureus CIG1267]|nr:transposase [Staphylococcus aureus subsp. aureus CIG1267]